MSVPFSILLSAISHSIVHRYCVVTSESCAHGALASHAGRSLPALPVMS